MKTDALVQDLTEVRERAPQTFGMEHARKRFLVNVGSNAAFIGVQVVANFWLTPFLIGCLGIAAFGMIALVNSITAYLSILTGAFDTALSRFLVIDLERRDALLANRTFNTALFGVIGIILALSPLVLAIALFFPTLFNVPAGWEEDASWLFALIALTSFVTMIGSNFAVSPFIHSRFLAINLVNFAGLLARIGLIVILFSLLPAHLWYAGGGALIAAFVSLLGFVFLWRKLTPELHVHITAFDRSRLRSLMGMGGWVIVNTAGALLLGSTTALIVVNAFFGAALTGGYGAVGQFSLLMEFLATAAGNVMRPVLLIKYAQQDFVGLQHLSSQSVKLLGLALALPVGLLCGFSHPILSVWLGPDYASLSLLLVIMMCHQSLNLCVRPLLYTQTAYNKIRWPGIATLISGIASLVLGALMAMWGQWGVAGVALGTAVAWTAKNALYVPIYTAHIMKLRWWTFLPSLSFGVIGTLVVWLGAYGLTLVQMPSGWLELAGSGAIILLFYAMGAWIFGLNRADRQLLRSLLPGQTKRHSLSVADRTKGK